MTEDLAHGDRLLRRLEQDGGVVLVGDVFLVLELGQIFFDRVFEADLAFVDEDGERGGGHRLGHGGDPEEGVLGHRALGGEIGVADSLVREDAVFVRDEHDGAGDVVFFDEGMDGVREDVHGREGFLDWQKMGKGKLRNY